MQTLVTEHTILAVVVGSRAYGLAVPGSDHDQRGKEVCHECPGRFRQIASRKEPASR